MHPPERHHRPPLGLSSSAWRRVLVALAAAIAWLALMPDPPPRVDTGWDKLNHLLAFAALGFAARGSSLTSPGPIWPWPAGVMLYGLAIEALQTAVPGRFGEWNDLLANAIGLAVGWPAAGALARVVQRLRGS